MHHTFRHSGSFGDIIYSLPVIKKLGGGLLQLAMHNLKNCAIKYGYSVSAMDPIHLDHLNETQYRLIAPLLERQPYITGVSQWNVGEPDPENLFDLDRFRHVLFRSFHGNYLKAYYISFNLQYDIDDIIDPWLEVDKKTVSPIVVARTTRYRTNEPAGTNTYRNLNKDCNFKENAIFVGTKEEHEDFEKTICDKISYYPVKNFLEMANVIAGSSLFIGNGTMAYSLAIGTNTPTLMEYQKHRALSDNECYFQRDNAKYF